MGTRLLLTLALAAALTAGLASDRAAADLFGIFRRDAGGRAASDPRAALLEAYPGAFRFEGNDLVFPDGTRVVWDDGRTKTADMLLVDADVEDMFRYPYPRAAEGELVPARDFDPGRVRSEPFFRALYGGTEADVRRHLTRVPWAGGTAMQVSSRFGIDRALARVRDELVRRKALAPFLAPPGGGFLWRPIAGTDRLSVHSFGAAVDISTKYSNYWLWEKPVGGVLPYRNRVPVEIAAVFEAHCFIWGGRWYHYDTMHFEYRPELLPGCRRGDD